MSKEAKFMAQLWLAIHQYLKRYSVNGYKLIAKEPNSISFKGKIPDIVIVNEHGIPQLIIETKKEIEGKPLEELLNPLGPAPIAQSLCYAALAAEEYNLDSTPLFATANRDALILFNSIKKKDLENFLLTDKCLEPKRRPDDWIQVLKPGALEIILREYIIDRIDTPLKEEKIKKLFEYLGKWITRTTLTPTVFYRVLVGHLKDLITSLHEYVREPVKNKILSDKDYFIELFNEAKKAGYPAGLLSKGILELKCPSNSRKVCEYIKEKIEKELSKSQNITADKAYNILSNISKMKIIELCNELKNNKNINILRIPLCKETGSIDRIISFDNLSLMMVYVIVNKILAYKILELHYGNHLIKLEPFNYKDTLEINGYKITITSPNDTIKYLNVLFENASTKLEKILGIKDFTPIFKAGLYDHIVLEGIDSIEKLNAIIELFDDLKKELRMLPGLIGYVYEGLLPPQERHQLGQFYTPPAVARLITRWAIRDENDYVLDGGCGSGTFLIEAYKKLLKIKFNKDYDKGGYPKCGKGFNEHQEILNQLYGVDVNAFATNITGVHLMLMEPRCPISKLNIETRDFFSLSGAWSLSENLKGFDAVIGNPPYTRWVEIPDDTKERILKVLSKTLAKYKLRPDVRRGKEPGIYVYWIIHTAENLLKNNGRLGMIISNTWLQTDYGVNFAQFLLDNFKITALIDLSFRLFDALISTVIILAEKESSEAARNNNIVTLIRIPPKIKGEELNLEKTGKILDDVLYCIENSIKSDGSLDTTSLRKCTDEYGIHFVQLPQKAMPRDKKWISLFFARVEDVIEKLENNQLTIKLNKWFEPSYGNALYLCLTSWGLLRGVRNLGAKNFFYFNTDKIKQWEEKLPGFKDAIMHCLKPAITRSQYIKTFTFKKEDWEQIKKDGKDAFIFVCSQDADSLPTQVRAYIKWGETDCRTQIRGTRGGGRVCSEAEACKTRAQNTHIFKGWYDLGGYLPTPIMAVRQSRYRPQFFYVDFDVITYDAIITLIPKIKIKINNNIIDLSEFYKSYASLSIPNQGESIDDAELKALLAYLNSTFIWLWLEQNARYIAKGPLALEANILRDMPLLNVKKVSRDQIEELAKLFTDLELEARELIKNKSTKIELFKKLKPYFEAIDNKIAEILSIPADVEWLWNSAWEMMERRIKGAKGPARPGASISIIIETNNIRKSKKKKKPKSGSSVPLDKWIENKKNNS